MQPAELEFQAEYDLPLAIVWDALVDEVLVEGWLASARIEPRIGGLYWLDWQSGANLAPTNGTITVFDEPAGGDLATLQVDTDNIGTLRFVLESEPGGTRGSTTRVSLSIRVDTDPRLLASTRAYWLNNFDQLDDLLHGKPVDWANWQRDHGAAWEAYRGDASGAN